MPELLFEIGTEELPPNSIVSLTEQIKTNLIKGLSENNVPFNQQAIKTFNTPRRIAVYIQHIEEEQPVKEIEVKGPDTQRAFDKNGNPTESAIGFAKKYKLEPKDLLIKKVNENKYVFIKTKIGGMKTKDLLSQILPACIRLTTGNKFMSWGNYDEKFSRPIRWILALIGKEVIDFEYAGVKSSNYSWGHRFLSEKKIKVDLPKNYEELLEKNYVIPSKEKRKERINALIKEGAKNIGATSPKNYDSLLDTVTNITEYPSALICSFSKEFQSLPPEVIETVLAKHQKYFVIYDRIEQKIKPDFIVITNGTETENKNTEIVKTVKKGNEKVVRARLNDAKFFFEEDLKRPFTYEERSNDLSKTTFQKELGTYREKVERLIKISEHIYENLKNKCIPKDDLITAIKLSKLDLTTHMVFEMPELQGKIGAIYALHHKNSNDICNAISEHYDQSPNSLIGAILSIADKLDNIICLFSIGKIPSGSTDPFALRRQAQSIINIILAASFKDLNINISELIKFFKNKATKESFKNKITPETEGKIKEFIQDKFDHSLNFAFGFDLDLIKSVCSVGDPLVDLLNTKEKINRLSDFIKQNKEKFVLFLTAAKRLIRIVEPNTNGNVDLSNLNTEQEKSLFLKIENIYKKPYKSYEEYLNELSTLTEPINNFFDKILVNDPDPKIKQTRQALLKKGKELFERICDFNQIIERN